MCVAVAVSYSGWKLKVWKVHVAAEFVPGTASWNPLAALATM
jgi:hypothetical protein